MRSSVAARLTQALSLLCAVVLCIGLIPTTALAEQQSLSLIPEGEQGAASIVSGAEGGRADVLALRSDEASSVDGGGAASNSENVNDKDVARINEDVPLSSMGRGYVEVELDEPAAVEGEGSILSLDERAVASADATKKYRVYFDANGGDWAPLYSSANDVAYSQAMPDITRYLASNHPPKRDKYVFMGFYDGSDWRTATQYYDKNFKSCGRTYPYTADGLTLYAGWAPVLSYKVPTSVSIAVGTVSVLGEPTVAPGKVVNNSPWPIKCSTITWDADELTVEADDILAAEAQVSGLLAKSVKMSASTLGAMFSPVSGVYLDMTMNGNTASVTPRNTAAASFMVPANDQADVTYTISLASGTSVIGTEMVSKTTLVTPFEAVPDVEATKSAILFDVGQGTGGQTARLLATAGEPIPDLPNKTAPKLEGWTFKGWFDSPDWEHAKQYYDEYGNRVLDDADDPILWDKDRDTVLYAGWDIKGCKVLFIAGGEGAAVPAGSDQQTLLVPVPYGSAIGSLPGYGGGLPEPEWVVDGVAYTFEGWFDADWNGPYTGAEVMYDYDGTLVLTARWSGVPVTVTWDAQGGTAVGPWTAVPSGSALSLRGVLPTTDRPGYIFSGWQTAAGVDVTPSTIVPGDITYFARWTPKQITLSWDVDGVVTKSPAVAYNESLTVIVPADLAGSILESAKGTGWSFRGWSDESGNILDLTARNPLPTDDATYTALWNAYVTFDSGDGTFAATNPSGYYAVGDTLPIPALQARPGYRLLGWFNASDAQLTSSTVVTAPVTYIARFDDERVTVTFDANNGTFASGNTSEPVKGPSGSSLTLPEPPTRDGYTFQGWSTGTSMLTPPVLFPDGDRTYTAVWQGKPVNITWDVSTNGGKWEGGSHDGQTSAMTTTQTYGDNGNKTILPGADQGEPVRDDYAFVGWFTKATGGSPITDESTLPAGAATENPVNVTYYARFVNRPVQVTFDLDGGTWNLKRIPTLPVRFNDPMPTIELDGTAATPPTRLGYDFAGFYNGDTQYYTDRLVSARPCNLRKDVTLVAKWIPWEFDVSFDVNNGYGTVPLTQHVTWEESVNLTGEPQHLGGTFVGWSLYPEAHRAFELPKDPNDVYLPEFYVARADQSSITVPEIYEFSKKIDQLLPGWNVSFPLGGGNITFYAVYQQVMYPKDSLAEVGDDFYLNITTSDANRANIPLDYIGYYGLEDIKTAANDIAEKDTDSKYRMLFDRIMQNDLKFTTNWKYYEYVDDVTGRVIPDGENTMYTALRPRRANDVARNSDGSEKTIRYNVRLIGINHDDLTTPRATESGTVTKAGFTFEFVNLMYNHTGFFDTPFENLTTHESVRFQNPFSHGLYPNDYTTSKYFGGWSASTLRSHMNQESGSVLGLAPSSLTSAMVWVDKLTHTGPSKLNTIDEGPLVTTSDKMFLLSATEYFNPGSVIAYDGSGILPSGEGAQYKFYALRDTAGNKLSSLLDRGTVIANPMASDAEILCQKRYGIDYEYSNSMLGKRQEPYYKSYSWHMRSTPANQAGFSVTVGLNGGVGIGWSNSSILGISPAFCL